KSTDPRTAIESRPRWPRVIASMRERNVMSRPFYFVSRHPCGRGLGWGVRSRANRRRRPDPLSDQRVQRLHQPGVGVEHRRAPQLDPQRLGSLLRLDVDVIEDLEVVGDEADRGDQNGAMPLRRQLLEGVDQVRPEPPLTGVALTLIREAPL